MLIEKVLVICTQKGPIYYIQFVLICGDDEKWRNILRGLNKEFYHKTVTTKEIENYISKIYEC